MMGDMRRDANATRQRILEVATAEFARHGIAGARVDRIAAAAGCNKAMLYAYFESKDRLFDAVFDAVVARNVSDVPIDADDLPEYAARLSDQYARYPEVVRLATWDRLERGGAGARTPVVVEASAHKVAEIERAQGAGLVSGHLPAATLLDLVYAVAQARLASVGGDGEASGETGGEAPSAERRRVVKDAVARLVRP